MIYFLGQGIPYDCNSLMHYTERAFASNKVSLTINVSVVYSVYDAGIMILMRANPCRWHWKGWALKIKTFLGLEMALEIDLPASKSCPSV